MTLPRDSVKMRLHKSVWQSSPAKKGSCTPARHKRNSIRSVSIFCWKDKIYPFGRDDGCPNILAPMPIVGEELHSALWPQPNLVAVPGQLGLGIPCRDDERGCFRRLCRNSALPSSRHGLAGPSARDGGKLPMNFCETTIGKISSTNHKHSRGNANCRGGIAYFCIVHPASCGSCHFSLRLK